MEHPEISVVIPCLNEEEAVGAVVDQAWEGIQASGRRGEVIVDNGRFNGKAGRGAYLRRQARGGAWT